MIGKLLSVTTALLLASGALALSRAGSGAPATAEPLADGGSCVAHHGEARPTGYGYRHVVVLRSACKKPVSCTVSTDVNPEPQTVTVDPGETREVVTFLEAPATQFSPRVVCK